MLVSSFPVHVSYNHRHMVIRRTLTMISGSLNYLRLLTSEKKRQRPRHRGVFVQPPSRQPHVQTNVIYPTNRKHYDAKCCKLCSFTLTTETIWLRRNKQLDCAEKATSIKPVFM